MHTIHGGLSIVAPLVSGTEKTVSNLLKKMNAHPGNNSIIPLSYSKTTLIASGSVIPIQYYGNEKLPALLIFFTSYCGPFKTHLNELLQIGFPGLCELFQYCESFPDTAWEYPTDLKSFLLKYNHSSAFYSGMHHIKLEDIEREKILRDEIDSFIYHGNKENLFKDKDAKQVREIIQNHIIQKGKEFEWARIPQKLTVWDIYKQNPLKRILIVSIFVAASLIFVGLSYNISFLKLFLFLIGVLLVPVVLLFILIRYIESQQQITAGRLPDKKMRRLAATQLNPVLNEMTVSGVIKQGRIRRQIFILSLKLINNFLPNRLIPTIATARWVSANNGKRLLFTSNYANTASSYVRDFIDSKDSTIGINILFCHAEGYPPTRNLVCGGAFENPEGFMNVFFNNQLATQFWYCPFSSLSVDNIKINREIRNGLFGPSDETAIKKWLKHL